MADKFVSAEAAELIEKSITEVVEANGYEVVEIKYFKDWLQLSAPCDDICYYDLRSCGSIPEYAIYHLLVDCGDSAYLDSPQEYRSPT